MNCGDVKLALKNEVVRKSLAERHAGSTPAPGTKTLLCVSVSCEHIMLN